MSLQCDLLVGANCYDYNNVRKSLLLMNSLQVRELLALVVLVYRIMEQYVYCVSCESENDLSIEDNITAFSLILS